MFRFLRKAVHRATLIVAAILLTAALGTAQTVNTVVNFDGQNGLYYPYTLTQGLNAQLYGTCGSLANGSIFTLTLGGVLGDFPNLTALNLFDIIGLTLGTDGNFYGAAGTFGAENQQFGILFRISPDGTYTQLSSFTSGNLNGLFPVGPPIEATDGNFYGIAAFQEEEPSVYRYDPSSGVLTSVYQFTANQASLAGGLFQGSDGNLYGTSVLGGEFSNGSIFKLSTSGVLLSLYSFPYSDKSGSQPSSLVEGSDGNFYGTTFYSGGTRVFSAGPGTFFKMTPQGRVTILYNFKGQLDGSGPEGLVSGTDGNFYGSTLFGETIFQMSPTGKMKSLYSFNPSIYEAPEGLSLQHTNGLFYGPLQFGTSGDGAVYSLDIGLAPFITFVLPAAKVGGTAEILGQKLTGTTSVTFHGVQAASFSVESDTYLTAVVPAGATTGPVEVTTPSGILASNKAFRILN